MKKSYCETDYANVDLSDYQMALNDECIEHLCGVEEFPSLIQREAHPRLLLPNLKYLRVSAVEEENQQVYLANGF